MERVHLLASVLLILTIGTTVHAKSVTPSEATDPVEQLEQLKDVLTKLGKQLQDLNAQIDAYVESEKHAAEKPEERRTFDLKKRTEPEIDDQTLAEYIQTLSPEDKLLLQHMKSKAKYLQGVLHEADHGANPGESSPDKRAEIPGAAGDADLQQFAAQLSPEDQFLLKKLGSKVKYLQNELHEGPHAPNPGEQGAVKKSEVPVSMNGDPQLQEFASQLSPADQLVLQKLQSRLKYLQGALHEGKQPPNPGESVSEQDKRDLNSAPTDAESQALEEFLAQLSPEDVAAIQHSDKKMKLLKAALKEPTGVPNPGEQTYEKRAKVEEDKTQTAKQPAKNKAAGQKAANEVMKPEAETGEETDVEFTAADRILLKTVAVKLEELRQSLESFRDAQNDPAPKPAATSPQLAVLLPAELLATGKAPNTAVEAGEEIQVEAAAEDTAEESPAETKPAKKLERKYIAPEREGEFGEFIEAKSRVQRAFEEGWHERPMQDNTLGIVEEKCLDQREEDCEVQVKKRKLISQKPSGSNSARKVNLREVLRTLRKMKNEAKNEAEDVESELDNLDIR